MVNSFDEFTRLKEVIVGDNRGFSGFHFDNTFDLFYWDNVKGFLKGKITFSVTEPTTSP